MCEELRQGSFCYKDGAEAIAARQGFDIFEVILGL